ncbi:MAG TPA: sigma-54 dependent transcriptional regulator [Candidatus Polarisedimenticolia bacterium]|nr:sigma-54 dependent transcriptional regulator [Candidatus Polarisedimenticolia bacterium]
MPAEPPKSILIVDDDPEHRELLGDYLAQEGHHVLLAESGEKALERLEKREANLVLTDLQMAGMGGRKLFEECSRRWPHIPVVILTAFGTVYDAVEMVKKGAYDYIEKPFNYQDLQMRIRRALEKATLVDDINKLREQLTQKEKAFVLSKEPAMVQVMDRIQAVAMTDFPVVLMGESGTGKEVLAREVHARSSRASGSFVPVNCGAIPRELFESELFGHVRGAFTGATGDRKGLFEEATGGTLFLDEISEIPAEHQVKLLRAIQEGEVKRVGDNLQRKVDVRIIAATNRDLPGMVKAGKFREDLFYRICVMPIVVPPLRERRGDILPLADYFLKRERVQAGHPQAFSRAALDKLLRYAWPGNIRELENKVKQSLILASGEMIEEGDLLLDDDHGAGMLAGTLAAHEEAETGVSAPPAPAAAAGPTASVRSLNDARRDFERQYLVGVLTRHRGNATSAAREAGKHRSEFYYLLKKHGLSPSDFREETGA